MANDVERQLMEKGFKSIEPEPNISQMLVVGLWADLKMVSEAFTEYTTHKEVFFNLSQFEKQVAVLREEISSNGMDHMTIKDALIQLGMVIPDEFL